MKFIFSICLLFLTSLIFANEELIEFKLEDQFQKIHIKQEFISVKTIFILSTTKNIEFHKSFINKFNILSRGKFTDKLNFFDLKSDEL